MDPAAEFPASVALGRFRVLPHRRELLADGQPIRLGGRVFDVLMALIEARGAVVSKDALMARVWANQVVEENNLRAGARADPHDLRTRLPVHRRDQAFAEHARARQRGQGRGGARSGPAADEPAGAGF
jgi:hypothetical protein